MRLEEYQPVSQLKLKENLPEKPKFPVIESYGHISFNTEKPPSPEELGRQPYSSREFFTRYADRILYGTDTCADPATARIWYRFLETRDEYFSYSSSAVPDQGRWNIYGIGLEDKILKKIYSGNAEKLLFQ